MKDTHIIVRKFPAGRRGMFRYAYWTGEEFVIDNVNAAMPLNPKNKRVALVMAKHVVAGERSVPYLQKIEVAL